MYTHMGIGTTEHQTARLGSHDGIGIALAAGTQIQTLCLERHMGILGQVLRIKHQPVGCMATDVKHLVVLDEQRAELRCDLVEIDAPAREGLRSHDHMCGGYLAQRGDQLAAAHEYLAGRAAPVPVNALRSISISAASLSAAFDSEKSLAACM